MLGHGDPNMLQSGMPTSPAARPASKMGCRMELTLTFFKNHITGLMWFLKLRWRFFTEGKGRAVAIDIPYGISGTSGERYWAEGKSG
jgi:hypothetical protein